MTDIVTSEKRSAMMSSIKGKDTEPELAVRKALFAEGFRFRLHSKALPGSPDIVLPKYRAAIFVHGCFWHFHAGCRFARWPSTRPEFWRKKLLATSSRDELVAVALAALGWRVLIVWECYLKQHAKHPEILRNSLSRWILGDSAHGVLSPPIPDRLVSG
jgi:DNA mismatch endonuclease (patch repair protein)